MTAGQYLVSQKPTPYNSLVVGMQPLEIGVLVEVYQTEIQWLRRSRITAEYIRGAQYYRLQQLCQFLCCNQTRILQRLFSPCAMTKGRARAATRTIQYMYRYSITGITGTVLDLASTTVSVAAAARMQRTAVAVRLYGCTVDHVTGIQVADVAVLIMSCSSLDVL